MHARAITLIAIAGALLLPAAASATVKHVVTPGESLSSIAETDGISVAALAAANNLSPTAELLIGQVLVIPPQSTSTSTTTTTTTTTTVTTIVSAPSTKTSVPAATTTTPTTTVPTTTAPATTTTVPSATSTVTQPSSLVPPAASAPQPTQQRVTGNQIAVIAIEFDVPAALAEAIGWQESGWNNDAVSSAGAVGVMQIVPSAWTWIDQNLTPDDPLQTDSASDNIRAGVLLLHELLSMTNDNYSQTAAAYYQGLGSLERHGMYRSTRRYVRNVLAVERRLARR